jgi:hypothetical protein
MNLYNSMFDLDLTSLHFKENQEQAGLPGLYAATPSRHPARGRTGDQLVMLVTLQNFAPLSETEYQTLLDRLGQTFFQIPGSVTTALRSVAEVLSQDLLNRNLNPGKTGRQGLALVNLAAIHNEHLYLAHCGPTHTFLVSPNNFEHFFDQQLAGRGLGVSRTVPIHFYQATLEAGSTLIFCTEPPLIWTNSLLTKNIALPVDALKRTLTSQVHPNLSAAIIQFRVGSGKLSLNGKTLPLPVPQPKKDSPVGAQLNNQTLAPLPGTAQSPNSVTPIQSSSPEIKVQTTPISRFENTGTPEVNHQPISSLQGTSIPKSQISASLDSPVRDSIPGRSSPTGKVPASSEKTPPPSPAFSQTSAVSSEPFTPEQKKPVSSPESYNRPGRSSRPARQTDSPSTSSSQPASVNPQKDTQVQEPKIQVMKRREPKAFPWARVAPYWKWLRKTSTHFSQSIWSGFLRLLPGTNEKGTGLSPRLLVFIAIAVPVIIAAIGLAVYFEKGQTDQYLYYFAQAQSISQQITDETDTKIARNDWASILILLDKADAYRKTEESIALRQQTQNAIDDYEQVIRIPFQSALVTRLSADVRITRMVTSGNDLYLLDSTSGSVIRTSWTSSGYKIDSAFVCGSGIIGSLSVSTLVDIIALPLNNGYDASIAGIDKQGNLIFCRINGEPVANPSTLQSPGDRWENISSFALSDSWLYVLDSQSNIGVYTALGDGGYDSAVSPFFSSVTFLDDIIDMGIDTQDLYLLHNDGHITQCTYSAIGIESTRCTDPVPYGDPRPGFDSSPITFSETSFSQIEYTDPPDPSIYILDSKSATIYHFSLRLTLQRLLRPASSTDLTIPTGSATAFYISQNRILFLAFDNQVFLASLP